MMDWEAIAKQQQELIQAFSGLKAVFIQAEQLFLARQEQLCSMLRTHQSEEAQNLNAIHIALDKILKSSQGK